MIYYLINIEFLHKKKVIHKELLFMDIVKIQIY